MRIALISDIHGNLVALEAALADIERKRADQIICLGDVAVFGPQPREVIARLRELNIPAIMGNTDQWLLNPEPWSTDPDKRPQVEIEMWNASLVDDDDKATVAGYMPTLSLDYGDGLTLLCYHGSPRSFNDSIRPATPEEELDTWFPESRALVMAGGHTHEPMVRRYGASTLVNPGSIGLPVYWTTDGRTVNPTWAEYALLEWQDGVLGISLRRRPYHLQDLIAATQASGMPHKDYWLADWRDARMSSSQSNAPDES
jgi:predicted phosphodiesterase